MNTPKNKILSIVLLTIFVIAIIYGIITQNVKAETIEQYEIKIEENNNRITALEEIKTQLHVTAELLRNNNFVNNGLDASLSQKWHECHDNQISLVNENAELEDKITKLKNKKRHVGNFKITHYCPCKTCNGSWNGITASGTKVTPYKTIAVDPKIVPLGSKVYIEGYGIFIAEDTGSAIKGNKIDLCVGSHSEAYARGVLHNVPVYIIS